MKNKNNSDSVIRGNSSGGKNREIHNSLRETMFFLKRLELNPVVTVLWFSPPRLALWAPGALLPLPAPSSHPPTQTQSVQHKFKTIKRINKFKKVH